MFKFIVIFQALICVVFGASIPDYIHVCKRDQDTISECVRDSIEFLRPRLAKGIPELKVPGIEPLVIPELLVDQGNVVQFKAVGRDVKVYGAGNFKLKKIDVDLDRLEVRATIFLPRLQFDGKYDLDGRLLVVPLHGKGDIRANATRCLAELLLKAKIEEKNGEEYLRFTSVNVAIIDIQDFSVSITNLFNGDVQFGDIANQIVNQNKAEFLRAAKPYIERTAANLFKKISNRIVVGFKLNDIIPLP